MLSSFAMAVLLARRELASALARPWAATMLGAWLVLAATLTLWLDDVFGGGRATMASAQFWFGAALVLWVPAVSGSSLAGRSGRTLASLPISAVEQVLGHWLAHGALVGAALTLTVPWWVALGVHGSLDPGPVVAGYLGLALVGGALCAVGVAASAWAERPATAVLTTLLVGGVPWWVGVALPLVPAPWVPWVLPLSASHHLARLAAGSVELGSVVALGAAIVVPLRVAVHGVHHRRLGP